MLKRILDYTRDLILQPTRPMMGRGYYMSDEFTQRHKDRMAICAACDFSQKSVVGLICPRANRVCSHIAANTLGECPENKWPTGSISSISHISKHELTTEQKQGLHNRTICLKCNKMETCESVETCKSCGGRRVVKQITRPCPIGKFTFNTENKK